MRSVQLSTHCPLHSTEDCAFLVEVFNRALVLWFCIDSFRGIQQHIVWGGWVVSFRGTSTWFGWLVTGLSLWRPGFETTSVHVEFGVDKVAMGEVFFPLHVPFHHHRSLIIHLSPMPYNVSNWQHVEERTINKIHYALCTATICSQPSGKEVSRNCISCLIFAAVRTPDTVCVFPCALYSFLPPIFLWLLFRFILYTNCALLFVLSMDAVVRYVHVL
jgi:hypothetical protein